MEDIKVGQRWNAQGRQVHGEENPADLVEMVTGTDKEANMTDKGDHYALNCREEKFPVMTAPAKPYGLVQLKWWGHKNDRI